MADPRKAKTLDEASRNPDGTYNGARALSWLSDVLTGGKGMPEDEVKAIWEREKAKRRGAVCGPDPMSTLGDYRWGK